MRSRWKYFNVIISRSIVRQQVIKADFGASETVFWVNMSNNESHERRHDSSLSTDDDRRRDCSGRYMITSSLLMKKLLLVRLLKPDIEAKIFIGSNLMITYFIVLVTFHLLNKFTGWLAGCDRGRACRRMKRKIIYMTCMMDKLTNFIWHWITRSK